jgi:hypothetical protein
MAVNKMATLKRSPTPEPTELSEEFLNSLQVSDVNAILLSELAKMRRSITASQALELVLASIDAKMAAIKQNGHEPMTLAVDVPMFW